MPDPTTIVVVLVVWLILSPPCGRINGRHLAARWIAYRCDVCGETFKNAPALEAHMKEFR